MGLRGAERQRIPSASLYLSLPLSTSQSVEVPLYLYQYLPSNLKRFGNWQERKLQWKGVEGWRGGGERCGGEGGERGGGGRGRVKDNKLHCQFSTTLLRVVSEYLCVSFWPLQLHASFYSGQDSTLSSVVTTRMLVAMATLILAHLGTSQSCCWVRPQRTTHLMGQTSPHCCTVPAQIETRFS